MTFGVSLKYSALDRHDILKLTKAKEGCTMKIAVVGWGSLIWSEEAKNKEFKSKKWNDDGPELPIEFTRKSQDGRLTLVITLDATPVKTKWAEFDGTLDETIKKLATREGTTTDRIGRIERSCMRQAGIQKILAAWLEYQKNLYAVIWTNLPPKFDTKDCTLQADEAVMYLKDLETTDPGKFSKAREYIFKSPVDTAFRRRFLADVFHSPGYNPSPD